MSFFFCVMLSLLFFFFFFSNSTFLDSPIYQFCPSTRRVTSHIPLEDVIYSSRILFKVLLGLMVASHFSKSNL